MKITPNRIRKLVEIAYVIEPLLDKEDCTTRFIDLPGKTIYDFILAGLNVGEVFEDYARSVQEHNNKELLSHFERAVKLSNEYKHEKLINIGLLEFMFVAVKSRLISNTLEKSLDNIKKVLQDTSNEDVRNEYKVFVGALSTSEKDTKKSLWIETYKDFLGFNNLHEYYLHAEEALSKDKTTANYQVAHEFTEGFPILKQYVNSIEKSKGLIKSIENTYEKLHKENPQVKIGILADFSAVAIFLYLSYQDPSTYVLN
ncbi:hypothetical protein GF360_03480 [candidate division WWE3 bacterium]|nr:hypothetical protein [candidate division WWE3 bacterium]